MFIAFIATMDTIEGQLASRAQRAAQPALSYFKAFMEAQQRVWSPEDPDGNLILTVAENKLSCGLIEDRLSQVGRCPPVSPILASAWPTAVIAAWNKLHWIGNCA